MREELRPSLKSPSKMVAWIVGDCEHCGKPVERRKCKVKKMILENKEEK